MDIQPIPKLQRNLWLLNLFGFFSLCMVIMPVIVPLFASRGLGLAEVFLLQGIFAGAVVLFEVPSGYFADTFGRRRALLLGSLFHGIGFSVLYLGKELDNGFASLVVFELTVALGVSLISGADLALLYETQNALGFTRVAQTRGVANLRAIRSLAEGVAALLGSLVLLWSLDAAVLVNAAIAWMPFTIAFLLVEAPYIRMQDARPIENIKAVCAQLVVNDRLVRLTCLNLTTGALLTFYVVWLIQTYWEQAGVSLAWFGVLWAAQNFVVAATSKVSHPLERRWGASSVLLLAGLLPVAGYSLMVYPGSLIGIAAGFLFSVCRGLNQVILTDALNSRVSASFRATANSVVSLVFRLAFIFTGPLLGLLYDLTGMDVVLTLMTAVSMLVFVTCMMPLIREVQAAGQKAAAGGAA